MSIETMAKIAKAGDNLRDGGRTLTLLGVIWCATQIEDVKQRVTQIEYRIAKQSQSTNTFNGFAKNTSSQKSDRNDHR